MKGQKELVCEFAELKTSDQGVLKGWDLDI
jgi:hypothetical protein